MLSHTESTSELNRARTTWRLGPVVACTVDPLTAIPGVPAGLALRFGKEVGQE